MSFTSLTARWCIPGVGEIRPHFDAIRIVSSADVGALKAQLPLAELKEASHKFAIVTYMGPDPTLHSVIQITCADDLSPLQILARHQLLLGNHRIVQVEIAGDMAETAHDNLRAMQFELIGLISKPRHFRKRLISANDPGSIPQPGFMAEPTFYFEPRRSSTALKCYCRKIKLRGGGFGGPCVRLEWTLKHKTAINRHLAGGQAKNLQLDDLVKSDLDKFVLTNLRLEKVDHRMLGRLIRGVRSPKNSKSTRPATVPKTIREDFKDPTYLNERAAGLVLRNLAYREMGRLGNDWQLAELVCSTSPAQIRGYLNPQQPKNRKRGRPKKRFRRKAISPYRINACFQRIQLQLVV